MIPKEEADLIDVLTAYGMPGEQAKKAAARILREMKSKGWTFQQQGKEEFRVV